MKNAFTKGQTLVRGFKNAPDKFGVYSKNDIYHQKLIAEVYDGNKPDADLISTAFNSATRCAEMGYDGQKCVELLPEIMKNVDQAVMGNFTMLICQCEQKRPCAACQLFDLLEKAKGEA